MVIDKKWLKPFFAENIFFEKIVFIKDRGEHPRNKVTEEGHIESGIKWTGLI